MLCAHYFPRYNDKCYANLRFFDQTTTRNRTFVCYKQLRRKGKPSSKKGDDVPTVPRRLDFSEVDSSSPEVTSNGAVILFSSKLGI